jgi:hypothetical protein
VPDADGEYFIFNQILGGSDGAGWCRGARYSGNDVGHVRLSGLLACCGPTRGRADFTFDVVIVASLSTHQIG